MYIYIYWCIFQLLNKQTTNYLEFYGRLAGTVSIQRRIFVLSNSADTIQQLPVEEKLPQLLTDGHPLLVVEQVCVST